MILRLLQTSTNFPSPHARNPKKKKKQEEEESYEYLVEYVYEIESGDIFRISLSDV